MDNFTPSIITSFGYVHTVLSVLSLIAGLAALVQAGRFDGRRGATQMFYVLALISAVTGLGIFHHGGFGPGHGIGYFMVLLLAVAVVAGRAGRWLWEISAASLLYFFDWFFALSETLTRFPTAKPFASSPTDPAQTPVRAVLFIMLLAGLWWQYRNAKRAGG